MSWNLNTSEIQPEYGGPNARERRGLGAPTPRRMRTSRPSARRWATPTAFESCDVILAPTTPTPAFKLGENSGSPMEMYLQDVYTISANLAGIPGLAIPAGTGASGLPVGIQLLGPVLSEPTLFGAGKMIE